MSIARTSPPAKLNLFLEIPSRRSDGYHEIDTVMVAVDLRDELVVKSIPEPRIELVTGWLPSKDAIAAELGLDKSAKGIASSRVSADLLEIPNDDSNLVVRALQAFRAELGLECGFQVELKKRIPAGAGLGGASSDAAHALLCAAHIHQFDSESDALWRLASSIGSDVPFFLPGESAGNEGHQAARASGRGEVLQPLATRTSIHFVIAYPPVGLSTAKVYQQLRVPTRPKTSSEFLTAYARGDLEVMGQTMMNRLTEPALEILPELSELIDSLWQSGLQPCQLTGSGSACFGIARDADHARDAMNRLMIEKQPGVLLRAVKAVPAAATIEIEPS